MKKVLMSLVVAAGVLFLTPLVMAEQENEANKIKVLNDSASALRQSNPDLAAGLMQFASREANEKGEQKDEAEDKSHDKLISDSVAALRKVQPKLAASLSKMKDEAEEGEGKEGKESKEDKD